MKKNESNKGRDFLKKSTLINGVGFAMPSYTFRITHLLAVLDKNNKVYPTKLTRT